MSMNLDDIFEIDAKSGASSAYSSQPHRPIGMEHLIPTGGGGGGGAKAAALDLGAMEKELNALSAGVSIPTSTQPSSFQQHPSSVPAVRDHPTVSFAEPKTTASSVYSAIGSFFGGVAEDPLETNPAEWQRPPPPPPPPSSQSQASHNQAYGQSQGQSYGQSQSYGQGHNTGSTYGHQAPAPKADREERKRKRRLLRNLRRLNEIDPVAYKITSTEASPIDEIEDELEMHDEENKQKLGVDMIRYAFKGIVSTIEWVNQTWDPFSGALNIKGLGDVISDKMSEYDPDFLKIQETYKDVEIPTEVLIAAKLAFAVGALNIANKYMSDMANSDPNMTHIQNNPEVRRAVQAAALHAYSPLPPPIETNNRPRPLNPNPLPGKPADYQPQYSTPAPARPPGPGPGPAIFSSRPDMERATATSFGPHESFPQYGTSERDVHPGRDQAPGRDVHPSRDVGYSQPRRAESGVAINSLAAYEQKEMSGPTDDISGYLAGLKSTAPSGAAPVSHTQTSYPQYTVEDVDDDLSGISFESLGGGKIPSGTRRRKPKSARATIALNI